MSPLYLRGGKKGVYYGIGVEPKRAYRSNMEADY